MQNEFLDLDEKTEQALCLILKNLKVNLKSKSKINEENKMAYQTIFQELNQMVKTHKIEKVYVDSDVDMDMEIVKQIPQPESQLKESKKTIAVENIELGEDSPKKKQKITENAIDAVAAAIEINQKEEKSNEIQNGEEKKFLETSAFTTVISEKENSNQIQVEHESNGPIEDEMSIDALIAQEKEKIEKIQIANEKTNVETKQFLNELNGEDGEDGEQKDEDKDKTSKKLHKKHKKDKKHHHNNHHHDQENDNKPVVETSNENAIENTTLLSIPPRIEPEPPKKKEVEHQECKVCGNRIIGYHYRITVCKGSDEDRALRTAGYITEGMKKKLESKNISFEKKLAKLGKLKNSNNGIE